MCIRDSYNRGAVYVLFMNVTVIGAQKISNDHGGLSAFYTLGGYDLFGSSLAALGDWDGDGIPDMAVGATHDNDGDNAWNTGAVYIIFLNSDGTVKAMQKISNSHGNLASFYTLGWSDFFGSSIAVIGDLDSDGVADLAVGAVGDDDGYTGALYSLFMTASATVGGAQKISNSEGGFAAHYTLGSAVRFGYSVASIDLNLDGVSAVSYTHLTLPTTPYV